MLVRLLYKSVMTEDFDEPMLEELVRKSSANNSKHNITGCLLLWKKEFFQALEGEAQDVNDVYLKIGADTRHGDIQLMTYNRVESRLFSDWSMTGMYFDSMPKEARDFLLRKYVANGDDLHVPEDPEAALGLIRDLRFFMNGG